MVTGLAKARALGVPRTPEERVAAHYGIDISEARRWLQIHPESELVPARGAGLTRGTAAGIGSLDIDTGSMVIGGLIGAAIGGVLGLLSSVH